MAVVAMAEVAMAEVAMVAMVAIVPVALAVMAVAGTVALVAATLTVRLRGAKSGSCRYVRQKAMAYRTAVAVAHAAYERERMKQRLQHQYDLATRWELLETRCGHVEVRWDSLVQKWRQALLRPSPLSSVSA